MLHRTPIAVQRDTSVKYTILKEQQCHSRNPTAGCAGPASPPPR